MKSHQDKLASKIIKAGGMMGDDLSHSLLTNPVKAETILSYLEVLHSSNSMLPSGLSPIHNIKPVIEYRNDKANTPLLIAASQGNLSAIRRLLALGADIQVRNQNDLSPLTMVISVAIHSPVTEIHHYLECCNFLIKQGADINQNYQGNPLIFFVLDHALKNNTNANLILTKLLQENVELDIFDDKNLSPLQRATLAHHLEYVDAFLSKGASKNFKYKWESVNAYYIAKVSQDKTLINLFDKPRGRNEFFGATPKEALPLVILLALENNYRKFALRLLEALKRSTQTQAERVREVINFQRDDKCTALILAATNANSKALKLLLELGADIGDNPSIIFDIMRKIKPKKAAPLLEKLLELGINLNIHENKVNFETPLHIAIKFKNKNLVTSFLKHGANPKLKPSEKHPSPYELALELNNEELINLLDAHLPSNSPIVEKKIQILLQALEEDKENALQVLDDLSSAEINQVITATDDDENTALLLAAKHANFSAIKSLVNLGANVNARNKYDCSAFILIIMTLITKDESLFDQYATCLKFLAEQGVNINEKYRSTPVIFYFLKAALDGNKNAEAALRTLLTLGLDLNVSKSENSFETPLYLAVKAGHLDYVKLFLSHGASPIFKSLETHLSPYELATELGNAEIIKLLTPNQEAETDSSPHRSLSVFPKKQKVSGDAPIFTLTCKTDSQPSTSVPSKKV